MGARRNGHFEIGILRLNLAPSRSTRAEPCDQGCVKTQSCGKVIEQNSPRQLEHIPDRLLGARRWPDSRMPRAFEENPSTPAADIRVLTQPRSIAGRSLFPRTFSEAGRRLSARLRHAGPPMRAKPAAPLCAHLGRWAAFSNVSEADMGSAAAASSDPVGRSATKSAVRVPNRSALNRNAPKTGGPSHARTLCPPRRSEIGIAKMKFRLRDWERRVCGRRLPLFRQLAFSSWIDAVPEPPAEPTCVPMPAGARRRRSSALDPVNR